MLAVLNGPHSLGLVVHQPYPQHWVALVRPETDERPDVAAWLCDSLYTSVFALSVAEVQDFIGSMGVSHLQAADIQGDMMQQERAADAWSAFKVTS